MPRLSRRGFLALGGSGTAAVALGACGEAAEPREGGDNGALLGAAIEAEGAYGLAAGNFDDQQGVSAEIVKASEARALELGRAEAAPDVSAGSGIDDPVAAAAAAIAAYREGARSLTTVELRTTATQFLAQIAGELAALRELEGDDPVPYAFVTGLDERPLEYPDDAEDGESSTTTTSTSTTTEGE